MAGAALAERARPVSGADQRLVEVPGPVAPLLAEEGLRRGSMVAVGPPGGGWSLALALAGAVSASGGWVAAVAVPSLNPVAAAEAGVDLGRLALVPDPGSRWAEVVAALVDGFDLLLARPPARVRPADARRLAARARERGPVMVLLDGPRWPEPLDVTFTVGGQEWVGLGDGHGHLVARRVEVRSAGRRVGGRERVCRVWLPAPVAPVAEVTPGTEVAGAGATAREAG